jgi:hypothetical protein
MYEKPKVKRFGTLRELTLAGGLNEPGDGAPDAPGLYHRS